MTVAIALNRDDRLYHFHTSERHRTLSDRVLSGESDRNGGPEIAVQFLSGADDSTAFLHFNVEHLCRLFHKASPIELLQDPLSSGLPHCCSTRFVEQ